MGRGPKPKSFVNRAKVELVSRADMLWGTAVLPGSKTGGVVPMRSGVKTAEDPRHLPAVELMDDE